MIFRTAPPLADPLRAALRAAYRVDETVCVEALLGELDFSDSARGRIHATAHDLVAAVREESLRQGGIDAFMQEYELSSKEGVVLMCLAEALLRIPDADTADRLIRDKLAAADWAHHLGQSRSIFVNASTWALMLTGRVLHMDELTGEAGDVGSFLGRLVARSGEPVIRQAMVQAMRILGRQFVIGRDIGEALARAREDEAEGYRHSYDMLGEAARTGDDAARYFEAYTAAIATIGAAAAGRGTVESPGISVKLSALHPRYELAQRDRAMDELAPRLLALARQAADADIGLTVDAEEADRLELSLDVIEAVSADPSLSGWDGFGLAVQAYQKRGLAVIDWLADLAERHERRLMLRLVKGAYWDSEIKTAQVDGFSGYPVFTRKAATDVSYLACAKRILAAGDRFYPQFATHNAHTLAAVLEMAGGRTDFEFQRLHGMGKVLYDRIVAADGINRRCRIYAPVGSHEDLLAYLVRRLLENGANTSFVNRIVDAQAPIEAIIADPAETLRGHAAKPHPKIPLPPDLYGAERRNARGLDLSDPLVLAQLAADMAAADASPWFAAPVVNGDARAGTAQTVHSPADRRRDIGAVTQAADGDVEDALRCASDAAAAWDGTPAEDRAACLDRAAELYETHMVELMALAVREAGKTLPDAVAEVREAIDFCRYYAARCREDFAAPMAMPGPTGERNEVSLHGRGVFACISPWNFPLAIFTGQVTAALAAGNAVIAKPAEQTPLIAARAVALLHEAGVPAGALQLLPGPGAEIGAALVGDPRIAGVAFTGSTETARTINLTLARREGAIVPLIAETGGQNCMIVDSSALPEQVVADVITSAFQSAGQRCSACRVLFLQDEIADRIIDMLAGAMAELRIGDPAHLETDIGPVIDEEARGVLEAHDKRMRLEAALLYQTPLGPDCGDGSFFAPRAFEIDRLDRLSREVFGPILHVIRYSGEHLDDVIDQIARTGYGLTLGIHSRIDETARSIYRRLGVGNAYVNRNMIGAVVGVQPFGGEGLSGTGPKAGGPRYLHRFAVERTLSIDTTAAGGNASLMSLDDDV